MAETTPFKIPTRQVGKVRPRETWQILDLIPDTGIPVFWVEQETAQGKKRLGIDQKTFTEFLEFYGFRKIVKDSEVAYVRVNKNVLYQVVIPEIKDFITSFFDAHRGDDIKSEQISVTPDFSLDTLQKYIYQNSGSIFNKEKLEMIKTFEGEMYQPGKWDNAFFFKDVWVKITPDQITIHQYDELPLNMSIWANSVIDFEIGMWDKNKTECDFQEFIRVITGKKNGDKAETQPERKRMLEQAIGYLMHPFFEGALRAILLTDVNSNNQKANGRTGKGLIANAIAKIFPTAIVPAKRWKSDDKFNFSQVDKDTKLIVLDDLASNFDSNWIFNNITEGTVVKKMYKSEFMVKTKMLLLTNQMIKGAGSSTRGRLLEIEIENFFNDKFKPIDYFGKNFYSKHDWNEKEWAAFYWYLMSCSHQNLKKVREGFDCGVEYIHSDSIEQKRLIQNLEEDFVAFMDAKCGFWFENPKSNLFEISFLRTEYLEEQNDKHRKMSSQRLKDWILEYCDFKGYQLVQASKGNNRIKYQILPNKSIF